MTTAVVVTTIVTEEAEKTMFVDQLTEQIRKNDSALQANLTKMNLDAQVVSTVFNLAEFTNRFKEWLSQQEEQAKAATNGVAMVKHQDEMSEAEFMDFVVQQLDQGQQPLYARSMNEEATEERDELIGDEFSRRPFLY